MLSGTSTGQQYYQNFMSNIQYNDPLLGPVKVDSLFVKKLNLEFENAPKHSHIFNWYQMEGHEKVEFQNTKDGKIALDNIDDVETGEYWVDAIDKDGNIIATAKGIVLVDNKAGNY